MSPNDIHPYFRNPRQNDRTVQALVDIIPRIGFNVPIVVDKDMVIIKGHSRWNASRILGLEEVPVIISEASDEQNGKDRILDNAIHELTEWDYEKLKIELKESNVDLSNYRLKWYNKVAEVKPHDEKDKEKKKEVVLKVVCPNPDCKHELLLNKKEILK